MTSHEAYLFGWVFGRLNAELYPENKEIGGDVVLAAQRPYSASAKVIRDAHALGILKGDLNLQIGEALCEITNVDAPMQGGSEKVQPLEIQGSWQLGYFTGLGKKPLSGAFDIAAARHAKKMTQTELANLIGVDQALVSKWETGKVYPNEKNMAKLKEALL